MDIIKIHYKYVWKFPRINKIICFRKLHYIRKILFKMKALFGLKKGR